MNIETLRQRARKLKAETRALFFAYKDPRTPWYAKAFAIAVVAYAFSPIDLIPDFIPVLGYLDDLLLVPAGIILAIRMIPAPVMADARARAAQQTGSRPRMIAGAVVIGLVWIACLVLVGLRVRALMQ